MDVYQLIKVLIVNGFNSKNVFVLVGIIFSAEDRLRFFYIRWVSAPGINKVAEVYYKQHPNTHMRKASDIIARTNRSDNVRITLLNNAQQPILSQSGSYFIDPG